MPGRLISIEALSEWLAKPESWIRWAVRARQIPHLRIGQQLRFDVEEIETWLAARKVPAQGGVVDAGASEPR